jgi:hypothetical protein
MLPNSTGQQLVQQHDCFESAGQRSLPSDRADETSISESISLEMQAPEALPFAAIAMMESSYTIRGSRPKLKIRM